MLDIYDALDTVSVHPPGEQERDVSNWHGVSTDAHGGIIAYFADEQMALMFRLFLVNMTLNGSALRGVIDYDPPVRS